MLTDEQAEQIKREQNEAKSERLLSDEDFDAIYEMEPAAMLLLPEEERAKFFSTLKWHHEERTTMRSTQGIEIGGKSVSEIAAANP